MSASDINRAVAAYYDRNTLPFLRFFGSGVGTGAIHREVWAPGVQTSTQAFEYVHHQIAAHCLGRADSPGTPHLLDLGCGVGGTATWLALNQGCRVHGVTLSSVQATLAAQRAQTLGIESLCRFETADMTALGRDALTGNAALQSDSAAWGQGTAASVQDSAKRFTAAYAVESLIHVADCAAFFDSVRRVLQPGGALLVCDDFLAPSIDVAHSAELERFRDGWRAFGLRSAEQVKQVAQEFGFELTSEQNLTPQLRCASAWLTTTGAWLLRLPWLRGEYWGSLRGSTALQNCIRQGLTEYRVMLWTAPGKP